jgi:hypothetical protein
MSTSIELRTRMSHEYTLSHSSETILHSDSQREKTYRERGRERETHKSSRTPIYGVYIYICIYVCIYYIYIYYTHPYKVAELLENTPQNRKKYDSRPS